MGQSRIEIFAEMAKQQPEDVMIWYGLANEYVKAEDWKEASDALRRVITLNPDYTAAYQLLGTALIKQGAREEARRTWRDGVETAERMGAWKARQHMEGLLEGVKEAEDAGFCE